jgi:hypothetical protein
MAESGRSPDGSGHSAEPEPISVVSAETASVPNAAMALAGLRHAYSHLAAGMVVNQRELADGLLAPAIRYLEYAVAPPPVPNPRVRPGALPSPDR